MSWSIKVPASTSNLGAGFDSVGLALNLYLQLTVTPADTWKFVAKSDYLQGIPEGTENLVYKIAKQVGDRFEFPYLPSCRVEMTSNIPLARGLGSSATATIAGIELANQILGLDLTEEEKLQVATDIEGHPDNVAPSLMGGCVIGHYDQEVNWIKIPVEDVTFLAVIPSYELKTENARAVLPREFSYERSVHASSVANVSVAAICMKDWSLLGKMMKKDLFHQPYRKGLIRDYDTIQNFLDEQAYGVFLSGAGPTMIAIADPEHVERNIGTWKEKFPQFDWLPLQVENEGVQTTTLGSVST
ncbi:homoserine kinase [Radiobacillus kanasensis]|uniref:homoserine kinase n=1 Tax=Radiobacillus kanasensis TaxID=2844358 RepID=UPI001E5AD562|nr:homoserine kinase [Radiobacillus kanasensis]UFT98222.1 homoserine kinase [Radiobacillus kanasensis]